MAVPTGPARHPEALQKLAGRESSVSRTELLNVKQDQLDNCRTAGRHARINLITAAKRPSQVSACPGPNRRFGPPDSLMKKLPGLGDAAPVKCSRIVGPVALPLIPRHLTSRIPNFRFPTLAAVVDPCCIVLMLRAAIHSTLRGRAESPSSGK